MSQQYIRILIADDHESVRRSLEAMVALESDMEVVGTAVNGREAIQVAQASQPDVIVMDLSMPEMDGITATGRIKSLGLSAQVIILSMHHDRVLVKQANKHGASAYIMKQRANSELIPAIRAAKAGKLSL